MTKKDFIRAAELVSSHPGTPGLRRTLAYAFADFFKGSNPRFDRDRFFTACGVEA